jgi:drug/metabolite transporter (DMT)-like permease
VSRHAGGVVLVVVSAVAFGGMAIFAKLAYRHGAGTATLLTLRFAIAGALLWLIVAARRGARPRMQRRTVVGAAGLGIFGYSLQAGGYFAALHHLSASMTALLLYTYPALVSIGAVALGREKASAVKAAALVLAGAGVALVLAGGATGSLNATGVLLAAGAALAYTTYILVADTIVAGTDPFALTAIVASGAFLSVGTFTVATGELDLHMDATAWVALVSLSVVCTVVAITTFFLGLERVGPSTASIVSTVEPACTVALAAIFFSERLGAVQLLGGVLVLSAVVVLQLRTGRLEGGVPPDHAAPAAAAREVAQHAP